MGWLSKLWPFAKKPDLLKPATATEVVEGEPGDDESAMIQRLELHRNIKNLVIARLRAEGINCKATTGNDPNGDIVIIRKKDVPLVQQIIRSLNCPANPRKPDGPKVLNGSGTDDG
jgi:hypothetical protein